LIKEKEVRFTRSEVFAMKSNSLIRLWAIIWFHRGRLGSRWKKNRQRLPIFDQVE